MIPQQFLVTSHTKHVGPGSTFVVIKGFKEDGARYITQALQLGATTIVIQEDQQLTPEILSAIEQHSAQFIRVACTRTALAQLSAQAYNFPAQKLKIIGITGTKGKSTTAFLIEHILRTAGYKTALLSTVYNRILDEQLPTQLTTQQPDYLHAFFNACVEQNVEWVIMEVAAQAVTMKRVWGLAFDVLVFTNFSQEHAEFYATYDDYFAAKQQLLAYCKKDASIILNADDIRVHALKNSYPIVIFFGMQQHDIAIAVRILQCTLQGLVLEIHDSDTSWTVTIPALVGTFNAYNVAAAVAVTRTLGVLSRTVSAALSTFPGVPGRLEKHTLPNGATAVIDYAHNPASFEAILGTLRQFAEQLIVVFGCGGERDAAKRPVMGAIASSIADTVILTADNPRSEDAAEIARQIRAGIHAQDMHKVIQELDREQAIRKAYELSNSGAIIAILGKGPDEYQHIGTIKYPFSEKLILQTLQ